MYNGGFFGGQPSGPLGIGVPSGWGNVDDTDVAQQLVKDRAKPPEEKETRRMRNRFLSWFPRAKRSAFVFGSKGLFGGLGDIDAHWSAIEKYPNKTLELRYTDLPKGWPQDKFKFRDEYEPNGMYLIAYLKNDDSADQAFWYLQENSYGLTTPGMGRLNRSIEAFVYCVLGAQVNMRSSIVGGGGIAQEVRQELTQLFEKAVIEEDLSKSVQRYQEAIENSHVKLDFAVSPRVWLLPSNLEINLTRKVGYNNVLRKATSKMKLGVNEVNEPQVKPHAIDTTPTEDDASLDPQTTVEPKKIANRRPATSVIAKAHQDNLQSWPKCVGRSAFFPNCCNIRSLPPSPPPPPPPPPRYNVGRLFGKPFLPNNIAWGEGGEVGFGPNNVCFHVKNWSRFSNFLPTIGKYLEAIDSKLLTFSSCSRKDTTSFSSENRGSTSKRKNKESEPSNCLEILSFRFVKVCISLIIKCRHWQIYYSWY